MSTERTFGLAPHYGIHTAREAHAWFLRMMCEQEEFGVETCNNPIERIFPVDTHSVNGGSSNEKPHTVSNL